MIEGGRTWNGSTVLKVLNFSYKLGAVDLLKTATSSDSCIQNKEIESHARHEGSLHIVYMFIMVHIPIRLMSH
jgi:hypothetical protein